MTIDSGRTDGDSWGPASSVGATATMVAASRAVASQGPNALLDDPLADPLVRAVGSDPFIRIIDGEIDFEDDPVFNRKARTEQMAVRTRFFDNFFTAATGDGARQAVILASGLDTRAYRLRWPAGTVVYEIDQPQVIAFKTNTLADLGAASTAERRTISIDLREDWPAALREGGFDVTQPTAWSAEGLLPYLPPDAQDRLFDNITELSVPGSRVATEFVPGIIDFDADRVRETISSSFLRDHDIDVDMPSLVYAGQRNHVADYLRAKGWDVEGVTRAELFERNGIEVPAPENDDPLGEIIFISGALTG